MVLCYIADIFFYYLYNASWGKLIYLEKPIDRLICISPLS